MKVLNHSCLRRMLHVAQVGAVDVFDHKTGVVLDRHGKDRLPVRALQPSGADIVLPAELRGTIPSQAKVAQRPSGSLMPGGEGLLLAEDRVVPLFLAAVPAGGRTAPSCGRSRIFQPVCRAVRPTSAPFCLENSRRRVSFSSIRVSIGFHFIILCGDFTSDFNPHPVTYYSSLK